MGKPKKPQLHAKSIEKKREFHEQVDLFAMEKRISNPPKCISDTILLYIRYGIDHIEWNRIGLERKIYSPFSSEYTKYTDEKYFDKIENFKKHTMDLYQNRIRGETKYISKNPVSVAAALTYIGVVTAEIWISQEYVAEIFGVTPTAVATNYRRIKKDLNL